MGWIKTAAKNRRVIWRMKRRNGGGRGRWVLLQEARRSFSTNLKSHSLMKTNRNSAQPPSLL
jgi:hypothetical protein